MDRMKQKRVLLVYQQNILQGGTGTNARIRQLLEMLKEMDYQIDQFSYEHYIKMSSFAHFQEQNTEGLIDRLYICDCAKNIVIKYINLGIRFLRMIRSNHIESWVFYGAQKMFDDIVSKNSYDAIFFFYTNQAYFLKRNNVTSKKIYFMEDCMFLQQYYKARPLVKKYTSVGKLLDSDLKLIPKFDHIFGISNDEILFIQRLLDIKADFFPHLLKTRSLPSDKPFSQKKWDVLFLGSRHPYNIEGLSWFMEQVYPHIDPNVNILLAGKMTPFVSCQGENITVETFLEDLDSVYSNVKVVICPILRGTGMKIKVVESMERGIPVVCTTRGIDGMPDKTMTGCCVADDPKDFANYINSLVTDEQAHALASAQVSAYYNSMFDWEHYKKKLQNVLEH